MFKVLLLLAVTSCAKLGLKESAKSGKGPKEIKITFIKACGSHVGYGGTSNRKISLYLKNKI